MKKSLFIILFFSVISPLYMLGNDTIHIAGKILDEYGRPMSAVIIEQVGTDSYSVSQKDGIFSMELIEKRSPRLKFRFIGYHIKVVQLGDFNGDSIIVQMLPSDIAEIQGRDFLGLPIINGMGIYLGYDYFGGNFDNFSELQVSVIEQLNRHHSNVTLGFSAYIQNIYAQIGFGFSPTSRYYSDVYRSMSNSFHFTMNAGYAFGLYKQDAIIITPYIGFNYLLYRTYLAPLDKKVSLDDYMRNGYVNLYMGQSIGRIGSNFDFKIADIKNTRHSFYASIGVGYNFRLHNKANISAISTTIESPNKMRFDQLYLEANVKWMFSRTKLRN